MSRTIQVEVSDEEYAEIERQAARAGVTPEAHVVAAVKGKFPPTEGRVRGTGPISDKLLALLGSVSVVDPRGLDNKRIDEDLAGEYDDRHEPL